MVPSCPCIRCLQIGLMACQSPEHHHALQLAKIANRKNTINGRVYKNDPTILSLELCNECQ